MTFLAWNVRESESEIESTESQTFALKRTLCTGNRPHLYVSCTVLPRTYPSKVLNSK